jgi:hypothetical protein
MPSVPQRSRNSTWAREGSFVVLASAGAYLLFHWALELLALSQMWDPWISAHALIGAFVPFATIAVASGLFVGAIVSVTIRDHSIRIVAWSGLFGCAMWLVLALAVGGMGFAIHNYALIGAPCLAVGLISGALLARKIRHA